MPIGDSAPPRKKSPNRSQAPTITSTAKVGTYEEGVTGILQLATFAAVSTGNLADAGAISQHGPKLAHEIAVLGSKSEPVAKVLNYLTAVTPYTALFGAVMPLVAQIAVNHKLLKATAGATIGTVSPEALEALMRAQMAEAEAHALSVQHEAEEQLRLSRIDSEQATRARERMSDHDTDINPDETY